MNHVLTVLIRFTLAFSPFYPQILLSKQFLERYLKGAECEGTITKQNFLSNIFTHYLFHSLSIFWLGLSGDAERMLPFFELFNLNLRYLRPVFELLGHSPQHHI